LPFIPKGNKYDIVETVAKNWYNDDFFCNELFNGMNPYTIRVISPGDVRKEFTELYDEGAN